MAPLFRFEHRWEVLAGPDRVYAVLADAEGYGRWWPQIRRVRPFDDGSGDVDVRSLLPFTLHLHLRRIETDEVSRRLRVHITGDLDGWAGWRIRGNGEGTVADYTQEVTLTHPRMGRVAGWAGPALRWNHTWMMSSGERGLVTHLTRGPRGRPES